MRCALYCMYVPELQVFLNSIDQKGDRLLFSLNHLSQHQSHSYKPADIPERHLGINPCRMSPQSLAEMHHTMHAQRWSLGGPLGGPPTWIVVPLDCSVSETTTTTRVPLDASRGQWFNGRLIVSVISTLKSIPATYMDRRMHATAANPSVHVGPWLRSNDPHVGCLHVL